MSCKMVAMRHQEAMAHQIARPAQNSANNSREERAGNDASEFRS